MEIIKNFIYGICMGTFEVVPGISGGTLAVLLNIYDKLIFSVSHLRTNFKENFKFLLTIVLGMGVGVYIFSHLILFLNENYPIETNCLLLGLIVGLVPLIFKMSTQGSVKVSGIFVFLITLSFMIFLIYMSIANDLKNGTNSNIILTSLNFAQFWKFVSVGAFAALCLMLPGCSGSMVMLVFGIYFSVIEAIHSFNFSILLPVGMGVLLGLILGSKLIHFCLTNFTKATYFGILGLILGSALAPLTTAIRLLLQLNITYKTQMSAGSTYALFMHILTSLGVLLVGTIFSYLFTKNQKT